MEFNIGDKVVPHTKTAGIFTLEECGTWKIARNSGQEYLFIIEEYFDCIGCSYEKHNTCDYFRESDLTLYKTKKLLEDEI